MRPHALGAAAATGAAISASVITLAWNEAPEGLLKLTMALIIAAICLIGYEVCMDGSKT